MQADPSRFAQLVLEQNSRAAERRCPVARASNEVVEILSDHWSIFAPGCKFPPFALLLLLNRARIRLDIN